MRLLDTALGWGLVTRLLHWAIAGLILYQMCLGVWMANFVLDLFHRFTLTQTHKSWGFVVFSLAVVRVFWRLANRGRRPPLPPSMPRWQVTAARASHLALYALLFVMPLSGWVLASASPLQELLGLQTHVFDWFPLPDPVVPGNVRIEHAAGAVHIGSAILLGLVLAVHAGAALKHQFVNRDGLLAQMIRG